MELSKDNSILTDILNGLIRINYSRIGGYNKAHEQLRDNTDLKAIFVERTMQSLNFITELKAMVTRTFGEVTVKIPASGKILGSWINIKNAFNSNKNAYILDSCEFGEDGAVKAYEKALKSSTEIPADMRQKITEQQNEIKKSHDFIKNFRDFNLDLTS